MKLNRIIIPALALTALTFGALWMQSWSLRHQESAERPQRDSWLRVMERQRQQDARLKTLHGELTRLRIDLAKADQATRAAELRAAQLAEEIKKPKVMPEVFAKRLAGVPGQDGKYSRLISPGGFIHAENVEFSSRNGSQLTFKVDGRRRSFMAIHIHPVILADLGLSLDELRVDQKKLNARRDAQRQQAHAESQARILSYSSMLQRSRVEPVAAAAPEPASRIQPSPEMLRELIARQSALDREQRARALAESAANRRVLLFGPPQNYGGGQQVPRRSCGEPRN